jgi:hypothetical protein
MIVFVESAYLAIQSYPMISSTKSGFYGKKSGPKKEITTIKITYVKENVAICFHPSVSIKDLFLLKFETCSFMIEKLSLS